MSNPKSATRRDATIIGVVGSAHFLSHFFQLSVAPLFPFIREELGVTYTALGLVVTVFYVVSGLCQAYAGVLVDRYGARRLLLGGMGLLSASVALVGLVPGYWGLMALAALAGAGNSVFHPADFAILNAKVDPKRLGRGFSFHAFSGTIGYAAAPGAVVSLALMWGWRGALIAVGLAGLGATAAMARGGEILRTPVDHPPAAGAEVAPQTVNYAQILGNFAVVTAFLYLFLLAAAGTAIQIFSVPAMVGAYGIDFGAATAALTFYLIGSSAGMLLGGPIADRFDRPDMVAMGGMAAGAGLMLMIAALPLTLAGVVTALVAAGVCVGATVASRDLLVRSITPRGATGKVFGLVYSGFDLGSAVAPALFGWLIDHDAPRAVFALVALLMAATLLTILRVRAHPVARAAE